MSALQRLAALLREDGGLIAATVHDADGGPDDEYGLLLEAIREGYELHYGSGRVVRTEDDDLALLAGDRLYALGLARLAQLGDLDAVAELADVISLVAQAHASGDAELADAVWEAGVGAVGWGANDEFEEAKQLARAGDRRALAALRSARRPVGF
jgi:hypothetical protein